MNTDYRQIVAVTGLPGLYQLVSTKNDGAIVKNLADNSIKFVAARKHQVTPLESIEIYTTSDNIRLHEVFEKMKTDDAEVAQLSSKKDNEANKAYFKRILPDYDADRVYTSDINKVIKWYALLKSKDLLNFDYLNADEHSQKDEVTESEGSEAAAATGKHAAAENGGQEAAPATDKKNGEAGSDKKDSTKKPKAKKETSEAAEGSTNPGATATKKAATDKATAAAATKEKAPAKKAAPKKKAAEAADATAPKKTAAKKKKEES